MGIKRGKFHIWALSIDDLRIHADLFTNPLVFQHYVEKHYQAMKSSYLRLNSEIDHITLYLDCNDYSQRAEMLRDEYDDIDSDRMYWLGLGSDLDQFYNDLYNSKYIPDEKAPEPPSQKLPHIFIEIINVLAESPRRDRRKVASTLLNFSMSSKNALSQHIENEKRNGRGRTISLAGEECISVVFTVNDQSDIEKVESSLNTAKAYACYNLESERMWLHLEFSSEGKLTGVHHQFIRPKDLPLREKEYFYSAGKSLTDMKNPSETKVREKKIGRNAPCPCGSGKKYKKCCG
jgi:hypothetical protein